MVSGLRSAGLLLLLAAAAGAQAESFDGGAVVVHYNALSTTQLTPAVADAYGIARSPSRGLLNVAVLRKQKGTTGLPIAATIEVLAINGAGQVRRLPMRRIDEPPSIYYLGELTVAEGERISFELQVTPEGARESIRLRLQHQFFSR